MTTPDEKYVVFKADEFSDWYQTVDGAGDTVPMRLDDAVVIRTKDIFAGPVLHTYAGAVQTAIEVIRGTDTHSSRDWISHLEQVRDYFHDRANEADKVQQKRFPKATQ